MDPFPKDGRCLLHHDQICQNMIIIIVDINSKIIFIKCIDIDNNYSNF